MFHTFFLLIWDSIDTRNATLQFLIILKSRILQTSKENGKTQFKVLDFKKKFNRGLTGSLVKEWRLVLNRLSIDGEVRKLEILLHNRRRNKTTTDKRAVGDLVKHKEQSRIVEPDDINSNKICLQQLRYRNFRVGCLTGTCQLQIVKKNKRVLL